MRSIQVKLAVDKFVPVLTNVAAREKACVDKDGVRATELELRFSQGRSICLARVIAEDDDPHYIWVLTGENPVEFVVLGGLDAYRISSLNLEPVRIPLDRYAKDEEYWDIQFHPLDDGLLVVYEGGAMMFNSDLTVRWHIKKYYTDLFSGASLGLVRFVDDDSVEWGVGISDGMIRRAGQD